VVVPHFPNPNAEVATLVATGRADAVEMIRWAEFNHLEYYRYLNAGYHLPLVGGTDKMSSDVAVGQYRTFVRIPADEEFSYAAWCRNLRLGRTFLSGGPMLEFSIEGRDIGDVISLPAGGGTVEVVVRAEGIFPIHTLQIVQEGRVVAQTDMKGGSRALSLKTSLFIDKPTWLCARTAGPGYEPLAHHDTWARGIFAHTSPIYVTCGDQSTAPDRSSLQYMLTLVDGSLEYIRNLSWQYRPGTVTHRHGDDDHRAYLERPFHEAQTILGTTGSKTLPRSSVTLARRWC
jgi:hypothetical protein